MAESESGKHLRNLVFAELKEFNVVWFLLGTLCGGFIVLLFQWPSDGHIAALQHGTDVINLQKDVCDIETTHIIEKTKIEIVYVEKMTEIDASEKEFEEVEDADDVAKLVSKAFSGTKQTTDTQNAVEAVNAAFGGSSE